MRRGGTARAMLLSLLVALASACSMLESSAGRPDQRGPLRVLIIDGESAGEYHDWRASTAILRAHLEATRRFEVEVATAPPAGSSFEDFNPDFTRHHAVILNYDAPDERWPDSLKRAFETYMEAGGGLVAVHAASNAFPGWKAFNAMIGVGGWRGRDESAGPYWYYTSDGLQADLSPGPAGSHGRRVPFVITLRTRHPVTDGLPATWTHDADELYAHLRGPGRNMTVLASAYSDPSNGGSGRHEPQLMVLQYGKGRVFHTTLGHDEVGLRSAGFALTFQRGTEWAATGAVRDGIK